MSKCRAWLAARLRSWAAWIDVPRQEDDPLRARVLALVCEQDTRWPERDGEAKRHQVYARLRKEYPGVEKRALSMAIEHAVRDTTT